MTQTEQTLAAIGGSRVVLSEPEVADFIRADLRSIDLGDRDPATVDIRVLVHDPDTLVLPRDLLYRPRESTEAADV